MRALLAEVRQRRGLDSGGYQRPTIVRRLQRRLAATRCHSVAAYRQYLTDHPAEEERLVGSLLIKVTDFFRDPAVFSFLRDRVLPPLVEAAWQRGNDLRIWSAGCATGEEAYSLALLVGDLLSHKATDRPGTERPAVRIFATDVDPDAIAFARRGVYPARSLTHVPADLLRQAFAERDGECEALKRVRDLVIFGDHDLARAAPFRHVDLVLCRNVLMYFTPEVRKLCPPPPPPGRRCSLRRGGSSPTSAALPPTAPSSPASTVSRPSWARGWPRPPSTAAM